MRALVIALAALAACAESAPSAAPAGPPAQRAFYYWRTTFELSATEQHALAELHVARLYVRAFDVVWDEQLRAPAEAGPLTVARDARVPAGIDVVPVVFVRAGIFARGHLDDAAIVTAAHDTWTGVQRRTSALGVTAHELQLDCDWTESTRAGYFAFLRALRGEVGPGVAISATIRLHQIKYRERTGVPPVDRGTLMFYNMGRFSADPKAREIFDPGSAMRYLARIPATRCRSMSRCRSGRGRCRCATRSSSA